MAKTKEELEQLKKEFDSVQEKLRALTEEELKEVSGGYWILAKEDKSGDDRAKGVDYWKQD